MPKFTDEEEWFINHWNDILTYPTIDDLCSAMSEPANVIRAKYRDIKRRCLLLPRKDSVSKITDEPDLVGEEWTSVLGWDGFYKVSNKGRVRSLDRQVRDRRYTGKLLALNANCDGYVCVNLSANGVNKTKAVHRLVMEGWTGLHPGMVIRHKDNDRKNNALDNLEWGTTADNNQDTVRSDDEASLTILDHTLDL